MRPLPRLAVLVLACLGATAGTAPAVASTSQESIFQDDAQLLRSGEAAREAGLDEIHALGADTVRAVVPWADLAPRPNSRRRPKGFDGADPGSYPLERWDPYDNLARGARARGLSVLFSPASPIPSWASDCSSRRLRVRRTCRPNPTEFRRFVEALGHRYSGTYLDENQGVGVLPRVRRWSVWNEPNRAEWLTPQVTKVRGRTRLRSPAIYRSLVQAAARGLADSEHRSDELLIGETAPTGRSSGSPDIRSLAPGAFLEGTFCLDVRGRPLRGAARSLLGCAGFRRLPVSGVAHHPYTRNGSRPPTHRAGRTEITVSSIARLRAIVRRAERARRIPAGLPIRFTAYGVTTDPPNQRFGVSPATQARFLNQSDWLAYREPEVASVAQNELRDGRSPAAFPTGLRFLDGREKPSFEAYRFPLWVSEQGSRSRIWGQVRPARDDARDEVEVQLRAPGEQEFTTVAVTTLRGAKGFVDVTLAPRAGAWRLRWTPPGGDEALTSRVAPGVGR